MRAGTASAGRSRCVDPDGRRRDRERAARIVTPETVRSIGAYPSFSMESDVFAARDAEHWSTASSPARCRGAGCPPPGESRQIDRRARRIGRHGHVSAIADITRVTSGHPAGTAPPPRRDRRLDVAPGVGQCRHLRDLPLGPPSVDRPPREPPASGEHDQPRRRRCDARRDRRGAAGVAAEGARAVRATYSADGAGADPPAHGRWRRRSPEPE